MPSKSSGNVSKLEHAVELVLRRCLGVRTGEDVLVVCNPSTYKLGAKFRRVAEEQGADAVLAIMSERGSNGAEPPKSIAAAMKACDVMLAPTRQSLTHTKARKAATNKGTRIATLPGVTDEMLARVMSADLHKLVNRTLQVTEALTVGAEVRITSEQGTDLIFQIGDREGIADAGELTGPGSFGNIPSGEGYISPQEGTAEGTLVVDGSIATLGLAEEPVRLTIEKGHLVSAEGGLGPKFMDTLTGHGKKATNLAEFGIGTNDKAKLTGYVLEDEKILGTIHIAFGASAAIGGKVQVPVHLDCVVMNATVAIDGHRLVKAGRLIV